MVPDAAGLLEAVKGAIKLEDLAAELGAVDPLRDTHIEFLVEAAMKVSLVDVRLVYVQAVTGSKREKDADRGELDDRRKGLAKIDVRALGEALGDKSDLVTRDEFVLILLAAVDEPSTKDFGILRNLTAIDGVEHMILVVERGELVLLAKAPVFGVGVAHRLAVVARIGGRERELLVGSGKFVASGGMECFDLSQGTAERVVPEEIEFVARLVWVLFGSWRGRQRRRGCILSSKDWLRRRRRLHIAGLRRSRRGKRGGWRLAHWGLRSWHVGGDRS